MSHDEVENLLGNIASDFDTPGVEQIHAIASERAHKRLTAMKVGGAAVLVLVIAGLSIWATRPEPTELATGDETTVDAAVDAAAAAEVTPARRSGEPAVAEASAPFEIQTWPGTVLQARLVNTPTWFAIDWDGVADSSAPENELAVFSEDQMTLGVCNRVSYDITWADDGFGFTVDGPAATDPNAEVPVPAIDCPQPDDGLLTATVSPGSEVAVEASLGGAVSLITDDWTIALSANPTLNPILVYVSLPLDDAAALADANDLPWRVVEADGQAQRITDDLSNDRLNFTTQGGIVIHVRSDSDFALQASPQATTTTTPESAPTTSTAPSTTTTTVAPTTTGVPFPVGTWTVRSLTVDGVDFVPSDRDQTVTIEQGRASGNDGCNSWGATAEWDSSGTFALTGDIVSTAQGCVSGQEETAAYNSAMRRATTWELTPDGLLVLTSPRTRIVLF